MKKYRLKLPQIKIGKKTSFFDFMPKKILKLNYEHFWGWTLKIKIIMQNAKDQEIKI